MAGYVGTQFGSGRRVVGPTSIYSEEIRSADTFESDMVDYRDGISMSIKVENTLDQPCSIQVVGNSEDVIAEATDISTPKICDAGGNITIGLAVDDWHPYIGVRITTAAIPTLGQLDINATLQR